VLIPIKENNKDLLTVPKVKKQEFMQTQAVSLGSFKKFTTNDVDEETEKEQSPALQYSRIQSRF